MKLVSLLLLLLLVLSACSRPPKGLESAKVGDFEEPAFAPEPEVVRTVHGLAPSSRAAFVGYGFGQSIIGTFDDWSGNVTLVDGRVSQVELEAKAGSVRTGDLGVDNTLKGEDFFDIAEYPTMSAKGSVDESGNFIDGFVEFKGVKRSLIVPANITDESIATEFLIDASAFGLSYPGVNENVRVMARLVVGKEITSP